MKKIKNIEKISSIYFSWKPSDIAFVKSLEWSIHNLIIVFYCQLRDGINEWPDTSKDFFEVSIMFNNISSFKLNFNGTGLHQISGFDILDISENGLERVNFHIEDYENDSINFFCEEVEIHRISSPARILFV